MRRAARRARAAGGTIRGQRSLTGAAATRHPLARRQPRMCCALEARAAPTANHSQSTKVFFPNRGVSFFAIFH